MSKRIDALQSFTPSNQGDFFELNHKGGSETAFVYSHLAYTAAHTLPQCLHYSFKISRNFETKYPRALQVKLLFLWF